MPYGSLLSLHVLPSFHAEYLTRVDLEEERENQEINARKEFDKGEGKCTIVPILLDKLSSPGLMPFYYCRGLDILSQAITDCECSGRQFAPSLIFFVPTLSSTTCFAGPPTVFPSSMAKIIASDQSSSHKVITLRRKLIQYFSMHRKHLRALYHVN